MTLFPYTTLFRSVNVAALEELAAKKCESTERSDHIILVKNLPYSCSEGDLFAEFGKYGMIEKIILPPTRALAVVFTCFPVLHFSLLLINFKYRHSGHVACLQKQCLAILDLQMTFLAFFLRCCYEKLLDHCNGK